jgi:hypothetical protein
MSLTVEFETIKQAALVRLPGADPSIVDVEARWVINEFLSETRVLARVFEFPVLPDLRTYALANAAHTPLDPDNESGVVLLEAFVDDVRMELGFMGLGRERATGSPRVVGMTDDRTLLVSPTPTAEDTGKTLRARVALTIPPNADVPMPAVLRPYHHYLLDGLLSRMYSMPDKTWTNIRLADPHIRRFQAGKTFARRDQDSTRSYGSLSMRGPRFGV